MLKVLVERGGEIFVRSLAECPAIGMGFPVDSAMAFWIRHDPASVKAWLERGDLPQEIMKDGDDCREDALDELAAKNAAQPAAKEML